MEFVERQKYKVVCSACEEVRMHPTKRSQVPELTTWKLVEEDHGEDMNPTQHSQMLEVTNMETCRQTKEKMD